MAISVSIFFKFPSFLLLPPETMAALLSQNGRQIESSKVPIFKGDRQRTTVLVVMDLKRAV